MSSIPLINNFLNNNKTNFRNHALGTIEMDCKLTRFFVHLEEHLKHPLVSLSARSTPLSPQNLDGAKMSLRFLVRRYAGKIDLDGKISNNSGDDLKR